MVDIQTLFGVLIALGGIVGGMMLEGGHIGTLFQLEAFLIVGGGTLGAILVQHRFSVFWLGLRQAFWVIVPPRDHRAALMAQIVEWSSLARRNGLLALSTHAEEAKDPLTRQGLQLLVDGLAPEILHASLEEEVDVYADRLFAAARVWEAAGGYAPTIGILGAVLGLIHVMENLADPSKLGSGIAVAFVATVYGVGSANLVFLPLYGKARYWSGQRVKYYNMLVAGLVCIARGENTLVIDSRLRAYLV